MNLHGIAEEYSNLTMLRLVDLLIIYKMIEEYTQKPVPADWMYYRELNEYYGIFYDDLWESLITFIEATGIGEVELEEDTLRLNLFSYESVYEMESSYLNFELDSLFKELQRLGCSVWNEDGFIYLFLEDFNFENYLIAELILKFDNICLEVGKKNDN